MGFLGSRGHRDTRRLATGRPASSSGRLAVPQQSAKPEGDLVGVVWGEGPVNQRGPAASADVSDWIGRLIRTVWRRFFMQGDEA